MLNVYFQSSSVLPKNIPNKYPYVLDYNGLFEIKIDGKVFLSEPEFSIYEFLVCYEKWLREGVDSEKDFKYFSVETEENPLISFYQGDNGWKLASPWERFSCNHIFLKEDFCKAMGEMKKRMR